MSLSGTCFLTFTGKGKQFQADDCCGYRQLNKMLLMQNRVSAVEQFKNSSNNGFDHEDLRLYRACCQRAWAEFAMHVVCRVKCFR